MFLRLVLLHVPFWINISEVGVKTLKSLHTSKFNLGVNHFVLKLTTTTLSGQLFICSNFNFGDRLRSLMEMCILIPGSSLKHGGASSKQVEDSSFF